MSLKWWHPSSYTLLPATSMKHDHNSIPTNTQKGTHKHTRAQQDSWCNHTSQYRGRPAVAHREQQPAAAKGRRMRTPTLKERMKHHHSSNNASRGSNFIQVVSLLFSFLLLFLIVLYNSIFLLDSASRCPSLLPHWCSLFQLCLVFTCI